MNALIFAMALSAGTARPVHPDRDRRHSVQLDLYPDLSRSAWSARRRPRRPCRRIGLDAHPRE